MPTGSTSVAAPRRGATGPRGTRRRATSKNPGERSVESRFRLVLERAPRLLPVGSSVLVAFSGGSDSTALLSLLCSVRESRELDLTAAHFDHGLRAESAAVAERAAAVCLGLGVRFEVARATDLTGGQAGFREARYAFLAEVGRRRRVRRIALAHQRDDHHETVLMNALRGSGLRGLAGIPVRRGIYVRPLLGFGRDELRGYLEQIGQDWVDDASNREPQFLRSRVRHGMIPALEAAHGGRLQSLLGGLARDARTADDALDARADRLRLAATEAEGPDGAQIARSTLQEYDRAARARILRKIARDMGFRLGRRGTAVGVAFASEGTSGHGVDIADGLRLDREFDRLRLYRAGPRAVDRELEIATSTPGSDEVRIGGFEYGIRWGALDGRERWVARLPTTELRFPLRVRAPLPGDWIRTQAGSRKLKKLLNERRVPRSVRGGVPVLVGADRSVLWVAGHATASIDGAEPEEEMFEIGVVER